ncbi:broad specificity phosphatase PhoE [Okibacterium sp. HSC-33S16]|uniref:histidine phosphatase family protein n=1 Tax=Okibacterium sp. HSC-33S16 TaxID=2910965 RepID=UPI00209F3F28|nr:histidine phosphatase family protein [Okibacterium sp. HSC-33S16]MCP2031232.1 broad specificity phosphatase PhoE [Okibacterium sp. HSC-33S16]
MTATQLWLVRHGESTANVLATEAQRAGLEVIAVEHRDADVPLSEAGMRQAEALGHWLSSAGTAPETVWSSPYLRARQTIAMALDGSGLERPIFVDERLRDRELGILDTLTSHGVDVRLPDEAARRRWLGKFYYRPPGGESWTDVVLRVRSFLRDADSVSGDGPILIAAHDAVVMVFLYVCLGWSEQELLDFISTHTVLNASVTRLSRDLESSRWTLEVFAHDDHLENLGAPVTRHGSDSDVQPR